MRSLVIVLVVWAVIYLPFLGSSELRGEEGHRVLPAVEMLSSGNYLVPHVSGRPYFNKPPLVNWIVAASFRLTGIHNDWTARLPSTFFVLAVAIVLATIARPGLGPRGSITAAVCWLTTMGLIEKGRTIEIDSIYVSCFALALFFWLVLRQRNSSPWLTLTIPWLFLGLGLLAKGPALLFFFYSLVFAVVWRTRHWRELFHPAHFFGIFLMLGIFAAWAIPYFLEVHASSSWQVWSQDAADVFTGKGGRAEFWAVNFPRGAGLFLPWILLLLFIRAEKIDEADDRETARGLAWAVLIPFVTILLLPGALPRYVLPLLAPICWLIGLAYKHDAFTWSLPVKDFGIRFSRRAIAAVMLFGVVAEMVLFPLRAATSLKKHERIKTIAANLNALLPAGEPLYAIDPEFQPYLLYLPVPVVYLQSLDQVPLDARHFLIQSRDLDKMKESSRWSVLRPTVVARTPKYRNRDTILLAVTQN